MSVRGRDEAPATSNTRNFLSWPGDIPGRSEVEGELGRCLDMQRKLHECTGDNVEGSSESLQPGKGRVTASATEMVTVLISWPDNLVPSGNCGDIQMG